MAKVYAVSSGCYSDYRVVAVFSTRELAELFIAKHTGNWSEWNDVEEYELDSGVEQLRAGFARWFVQMREDGSGTRSDTCSEFFMDAEPDDALRAPTAHSVPGLRWFNWYGWAKDADHAVKIANEHRIRLLLKPDEVKS